YTGSKTIIAGVEGYHSPKGIPVHRRDDTGTFRSHSRRRRNNRQADTQSLRLHQKGQRDRWHRNEIKGVSQPAGNTVRYSFQTEEAERHIIHSIHPRRGRYQKYISGIERHFRVRRGYERFCTESTEVLRQGTKSDI